MKLAQRYLILALTVFFAGCTKDASGLVSPPATVPSTLNGLFQGTWRETLRSDILTYLVFDSTAGTIAIKGDLGYDFRFEYSSSLGLDSSHIRWLNYDGSISSEVFYHLSADTLYTSYDSLGNPDSKYVRYGSVSALESWTERLEWTSAFHYPHYKSDVRGLACLDSAWLVRSVLPNLTNLDKVPFATDTVISSLTFANVSAMEVQGTDLWLAGRYFIEQRRMSDQTVLAHYNIGTYFDQQNDGIHGITVSGSTIYLATDHSAVPTPTGRMLRFTTGGQFIDSHPTYSGINDLASVNGRIWCTIGSGFFYEIDPVSARALHTYYLVLKNYFRYEAIAIRQGKLECVDFINNYLKIFEVPIP